jgi:hypothetical protein
MWETLSRACHVHAYELDPTADELRSWIDAVADVRYRLRSQPSTLRKKAR